MKRVIALLLSTTIVGCAGYVPPTIPVQTPQQIAATVANLKASGVTPGEYMNAYFQANLENCDNYLLAQAELNGNFGTAAKVTSLGTALATGALGLGGAGNPATALAGVAGGALVSALNIGSSNTGIPYSAATAEKVQEAMIAFMQSTWANPPPPTLMHAAILGELHRWICTPAGITWLAGTSISTAQVGAINFNQTVQASVAPQQSFAVTRPFAVAPPQPPGFGVPVITINKH